MRGSTPSRDLNDGEAAKSRLPGGSVEHLGPCFALTCREGLRSGTQMVQWVGMFEDCANAGIRLWRRKEGGTCQMDNLWWWRSGGQPLEDCDASEQRLNALEAPPSRPALSQSH